MDICTKFHGNPSYSCRDMSVKNKNVNLLVVLEKVSRLHPLRTMNVQTKFLGNSLNFSLDQSGGPTDQNCNSESHAKNLLRE